MTVIRHWLAESTGLVEPVRVIHSEATADSYRKRDGWRVTGPFVPEPPEGAVSAMREAAELLEEGGTPEYVNPPTAEAMQRVAAELRTAIRGQSGGADELDKAIRAAADDPADGRSIEDILITAGQRMRRGEPLTVALAHAADPSPRTDQTKEDR